MAEEGWTVLDEQGRLFGIVNIIDFLVVLLCLTVVVAGAVLLFAPTGEEDEVYSETRYVTLDLGPQPAYMVDQITTGDEWVPDSNGGSLVLTDVYRVREENKTRIIARAEVTATSGDTGSDGVQFANKPLFVGRTVSMEMSDYRVRGNITAVDTSGETVPVREFGVVVETTLSPSLVESISVGDEYTIAGETVGTVESVELYPADGNRRYALVGLSLQTLEQAGRQQFAGGPLRIGDKIEFETAEYVFEGTVVRRKTTTVESEPRQFVVQTEVPTQVSTEMADGDSFTIGKTDIVTVESVTVYATSNPDIRRVVLGISALSRSVDGSIVFGQKRLKQGSSIPIETDEYAIESEIIRTNSLEEPGVPTTRTVRMELDNLSPDRAETIVEGMEERIGESTTARILNVSRQPSTVLVQTNGGDLSLGEHPREKDLVLTVELTVRERDDGRIRFRGETLRLGQSLVLEVGTLTIEGEISELDDG